MPAVLVIDPKELEAKWRNGSSAQQLAKMYNCSLGHIYKIRRKQKLDVRMKNSNAEPPPPTALDERLSRNSLVPSPWVLARIAALKAIR